jgi:hypothetical protein
MLWMLSKLISLIDRDKVIIESKPDHTVNTEYYPEIHEMVNLTCDRCKAPKLYQVGNVFSYTLHCFACDKIDRVVSL